MKSIFYIFLIVLFISGCAHKSIRTEPYISEQVKITSGMAKVIFYRPEDTYTQGWESTVQIDKKVVGFLPPSSFFYIDVEPGNHNVQLKFPALFELTPMELDYVFESDVIYYIRLSSRLIDHNKVGRYVEIIPKYIAEVQLSCCLQSESISIGENKT